MIWEKPSFEPIDMNAEVGGYQGDEGEGPDRVEPAAAAPPLDRMLDGEPPEYPE